MKTATLVIVLIVVLSSNAAVHASRLDRALKQASTAYASSFCNVTNGDCRAVSRSRVRSYDDVDREVTRAWNRAVARVEGDGDAYAEAESFARAIASAYATIISRHVGRVYVNAESGQACAYTRTSASAFADAIARTTARTFARARNDFVRASERCFSRAIHRTSVLAVQNANYGVCTTYGYDFFNVRLTTVGYARAVAVASNYVLAAVKNGDTYTEAHCEAYGESERYITTTAISG